MKQFLTCFILFFNCNTAFTQQKEIWFFPPNQQISISDNKIEISENFNIQSLQPYSYFTILDSSGNILFYLDGQNIYNKEYKIMENGHNLGVNDQKFQNFSCVHNPDYPNIYNVFYSDENLYLVTIDLSYNAYNGKVIKNEIIHNHTTGHIISYPNPCGGVWIIVFDQVNRNYLSFLYKNNKLESPIISKVGNVIDIGLGLYGGFRMDSRGEILATTNILSFLEFYSFDKYSGKIKNPILFKNQQIPSVENAFSYFNGQFSNNGRYYYGIINFRDSILISQIDLEEWTLKNLKEEIIGKIPISNNSSILSSINKVQNKLFITTSNYPFISVIERPNEKGLNSNFILNGITLPNLFYNNDLDNYYSELVIYFDPESKFHLPSDTILCEGETIELDFSTRAGQVIWNDHSSGLKREITGPGTYIATYTPDQGCPTTDTFIVTQPPEFMSLDTFICFGSTLTYKGITYRAQETYQDTFITHGCETIYEYRIKEYPLPYNENLLPGDTILCTDESIFIDLSFVTEPLTWEDGSTDNQRILDEGGLYFVNLQSIDGCIHTDSLLVEFSDPEVVFLDTTICFGEEIKIGQNIIDTKGIYYDTIYDMNDCPIYYETSVSVDSSGLIADTLFSEIKKGESFYWNDIIYSEPGLYSYSRFNENGCPISSFLRLSIEKTNPLIIPNIISPNNDGINDAFIVEGAANSNISIQSLSIFDRFGSLIHRQAGNLSKDEVYWDNSAQSIAAGVYVYVIQATIKGETQYFTGSVTVIY